MEDTKKTKRSTSKNKNKNNHEPKWKAKKEGTAKKTVTTKKKTTTTKKATPKKETKPVAKEKIKEEVKKIKKEVVELKEDVVEIKEEVKELSEKEQVEKIIDEIVDEKDDTTEPKEITKEELNELVEEQTKKISLPKQEELDRIYDEMTSANTPKAPEKESFLQKYILGKKHYNYLSRIVTLIVMIILFLILCVLFVFKALDYQLGGSTTYSEYTSNDYIVCTDGVTVYNNENCLAKDLDYVSNVVKNIHATFNYEAVYNKKHTFNSNYSVIAKLKIFEQNDANRIRYTKDNTLINDTNINVNGEVITFSADADIDFNYYSNIVMKYIQETGVVSSAEVEVGLYLKDGNTSRKISYITIPLTEESFMIKSSNLDNQNQLVISNIKTRTIDPFYVFIAVICLLMDILLFTYLANFIYMVQHQDNEYNARLKAILRDNDELIVNATSDYVIAEDANVVEVESFEELMDARNTLEKPIVYEKINNIKSKFYVEDGNTIYVYTMKDDGE